MLDFLRRQAAGARWVTSVCTGSLLLAAAGLLQGRRATCHWLSIDHLALFGVQACADRVVVDGDRITGGGVTSGLDFAFTVLSVLRGEEAARTLQLLLEYDPAPPFDSGHPRIATPDLVNKVKAMVANTARERRDVSARAAQSLAAPGTGNLRG